MKNITEIIFILDRSGSMHGLEDDTIGGFNSFIEQQKKEEGEAFITTILFDDQLKIIHDRENIKNIRKMTRKDYYVGGCTALLDTVGFAIKKAIQVQKKLPVHQKADHVLFVITTDGYENASCEYTYSQINKLIQYQQKHYDWEFLFLGARIDAIKEASKLGIPKTRAVRFYEDSEGIDVSYKGVSQFASQLRSNNISKDDTDWKEETEVNFLKQRHV